LRRINRYSSKWTSHEMNKRSVACVSLLEWVHSIERLHGIERIEPEIIVTPLEEEILKKKKKKRKKMKAKKKKKKKTMTNTAVDSVSVEGSDDIQKEERPAPPSPRRSGRGTVSMQQKRRTREVIKDTVIRGSEADW
jgi:hypothetical protein